MKKVETEELFFYAGIVLSLQVAVLLAFIGWFLSDNPAGALVAIIGVVLNTVGCCITTKRVNLRRADFWQCVLCSFCYIMAFDTHNGFLLFLAGLAGLFAIFFHYKSIRAGEWKIKEREAEKPGEQDVVEQ